MSTGHVWELRFQAGTSNKFYRVYTVSNGGHYAVYNWGRWGSRGQFKVEQHSGQHAVNNSALDKLDAKRAKGYELLRQSDLPVVPQDILDVIEQATNVRPSTPVPTPETAAVSVFDQFAADTDRLIRMVTSSPDLTPDAVVLRSGLIEQLDTLRARLGQAEGQLELVNDVVAMKAGAP